MFIEDIVLTSAAIISIFMTFIYMVAYIRERIIGLLLLAIFFLVLSLLSLGITVYFCVYVVEPRIPLIYWAPISITIYVLFGYIIFSALSRKTEG